MSKRTGTKVQKNRTDDEFIMLPTVDFCFKELMQNENIRKGIVAALLKLHPEDVEKTDLMPTILQKQRCKSSTTTTGRTGRRIILEKCMWIRSEKATVMTGCRSAFR